MSTAGEFVYRFPRRASGWRPGSHPGSSLGAGQEFISHSSLHERPDPRRLDLRASLRSARDEWLVRVTRQRTSIAVHCLVDVSRSMQFGSRQRKLDVAAQFVEALGQSAFRAGDRLGMVAFDHRERPDLFVPALLGRGTGVLMASLLRNCSGGPGGCEGLEEAAVHLAGRPGLVFLISDFHWPLARLGRVLDTLAPAYVVPMILWDPAETEPPSSNELLVLRDSESQASRVIWMRPGLREKWIRATRERREELDRIFSAHHVRPLYLNGTFDSDSISRYFLEAVA